MLVIIVRHTCFQPASTLTPSRPEHQGLQEESFPFRPAQLSFPKASFNTEAIASQINRGKHPLPLLGVGLLLDPLSSFAKRAGLEGLGQGGGVR